MSRSRRIVIDIFARAATYGRFAQTRSIFRDAEFIACATIDIAVRERDRFRGRERVAACHFPGPGSLGAGRAVNGRRDRHGLRGIGMEVANQIDAVVVQQFVIAQRTRIKARAMEQPLAIMKGAADFAAEREPGIRVAAVN